MRRGRRARSEAADDEAGRVDGLWGEEVDAIQWLTDEIEKAAVGIKERRAKLDQEAPTNYGALRSSLICACRLIRPGSQDSITELLPWN